MRAEGTSAAFSVGLPVEDMCNKQPSTRMQFFGQNVFVSDQEDSMIIDDTLVVDSVSTSGRKCRRKRKSGECSMSAGGHSNKRIHIGSIVNTMESCGMVSEADGGAELSDDHLLGNIYSFLFILGDFVINVMTY
ncbi:uncharacterized protein LOC126788954 [Argentina anserina]|uniref:uncharacterized protein LOC126788954 n=1 Tax=Argentina anserina TaxID=57926 RepID=UPI0021762FA4|nr:uncharacterized protein LOC126788954 [Potentilla anserina]